MKKLIRALRQQMGLSFWQGVRLAAPILLGAALIGIVISTVWFGGKRESLAAYAEANLLRFALKAAVQPARSDSRVVVISVKDSDLQTLQRAPHQLLRDAHIEEYASIVERVAAHNPELIVVSWLGNAQPLTAEYLRPLTDTVDRLGIASKTILAVHFFATGSVPEELTRKYQMAEARDCYYEVNSFCTWNPEWTWMPQRIADAFWREKARWALSTNLPHTLPNFVLNLPEPGSLPTFSFLDFRPPVTAQIGENSAVFIGNDATQDLQFRNNKDLLQKTYVAASPSTRNLLSDGIPFHVFWAGLAEMFINGDTVSVVPEWLCLVALIAICASILVSIHHLNGMALGPFLLCAISLPLLNAVALRYGKLYMPVVPIIAAGFAIFIAATFISVAAYSYRRWRFLAAEANAARTADIKENFISLISHNLNTPIAQLRGLLDVLIQREADASGQLPKALLYLEYMRVTVRAVLNTSVLGQNPESIVPGTVRQFWLKFMENEQIFLGRLGIEIEVDPKLDDEDNGEIWYYRYSLDTQVCYAALLYSIIFAHVKYGAQRLSLKLAPLKDEPAAPQGLVIRVEWNPVSKQLPVEFSLAFIGFAMSRYLETAAETRGITAQFESSALVLTLPDAYKHSTQRVESSANANAL